MKINTLVKMDISKMAYCLAGSLTDCIIDSEDTADFNHQMELLNFGLKALANRDLNGIRTLFKDGYTFPLGLDPDQFEGFIGVQVFDRKELIGIIDKSDIIW